MRILQYSYQLLLLAIALLTAISFSMAEEKIFVIRNKDGSLLFSTKPPKDGRKTEVFSASGARYSYTRYSGVGRRLFRERFASEVRVASLRYGVDEALIRAVIHAESAFQPKAVSPKGAVGLMQIMPANFRLLGLKEPFEPGPNILAGTRYLSGLLKQYKGNIRLALAAYNAGPGAVEKYRGVPPFKETENYIRRVTHYHSQYQRDS